MEGYAASQKLNSERLKGLRRGNITVPVEGGSFREFKGKPNYIVLNHDAISNEKIMKYILEEFKPDNMIIDEFHCFKCPTTNRTKAALKISNYIHEKGGNVILMSGTPITKDIRDIYAPCQLVDPYLLPITFTEFKRRFCNIQGGYSNGDAGGFEKYLGEKNQDELKQRTCARSHRVLIQDVHDMPKKVETIKYVQMSEEQVKHHQMLKKLLYTQLPKDDSVLGVTAMTKLLKMVQITGGYIYDEERNAQLLKTNPKLLELDNMLQQILSNDKNNVVLFTNFRTPVKMLRDYLKKSPWSFSELSTQAEGKRSQAVWDFQNDKSKRIMLAQPVLCPGNDFSKANYAIFYDNNYKYVDRDQAETRIFTHTSIEHGTVVVIDLICKDSVDEFLYEIIQKKKNKNLEFTKEEVWNFLKK
jgi:SNF2 family DNA or RNA helicase